MAKRTHNLQLSKGIVKRYIRKINIFCGLCNLMNENVLTKCVHMFKRKKIKQTN